MSPAVLAFSSSRSLDTRDLLCDPLNAGNSDSRAILDVRDLRDPLTAGKTDPRAIFNNRMKVIPVFHVVMVTCDRLGKYVYITFFFFFNVTYLITNYPQVILIHSIIHEFLHIIIYTNEKFKFKEKYITYR